MAKEKKEETVDKKVKLSYEIEFALVGLMLAIISLIGLVNQGYIGSLITFALVYLFGCWYQIPLFAGIFFGSYFFITRKKPKMVTNLNVICFALFIVFLAIASSKYDGADIDNCFTFYKSAFSRCHSGIHVDIALINQVGGGLIGYILYALIVTVLGEFMTSVVVVILVLSFGYFAFKRPVLYTYNLALLQIEKRKQKNKDKNKKLKTKENKNSKKEDVSENEETHFLTFDIFTQPIFEEEIAIKPLIHEEVKEEVIFDYSEIKKEESNISSNTSEADIYDYSNEELEVKREDSTNYDKYTSSYEFEEKKEISEEVTLDDEVELREDLTPEFVNFSSETNNEVREEVKEEIIKDTPIYSEPYIVSEHKEEVIDDVYSLLNNNVSNNASDELRSEVEGNCLKINQKLEELNIKAKVSDYIIGPCVTRYEIVPEIGVKVSSIVNIQNDLKLALAAVNLRMEAPIPGKSAIGIEVANKKRYPVFLKEVLDSKRDNNDKLLVAIGKDLANEPVTISIDKMPHLLIAGATGSGKSVCINAIIMSLILRATPEEVKLILVDPKKVEMLPYANMPHLLCPVVTDPKKANNALKKVVVEMERRYDMFANNGVRNIEGYNNLTHVNKLYKLVVIIDELADLMLACSKEVEESIQRITQLARAAGIYLIVATQRPSVDVITGVIKANIPSRIAFSVSSMVDSRTILDRAGAEDLLGKGDMLMDISGTNALNRVQGVLVSDEEIFNVVKQIKLKYDVNFNEEFLNLEDDKKEVISNLSEIENTVSGDDSLYNEIKAFVIKNQKASTSLLQIHFSLGYNRAARMMLRLEEEGIVSASDGNNKSREVLVKEEDENENI